jgi:O-succinylhomoserine sulfhydrylase
VRVADPFQPQQDSSAALGVETRLVRGGLTRSNHGETSEAIFLTSGFVYDDAASAEARFAGEQPGFMYSRYANPTIEMFERRMALLEGAEACHATASGMAAVFASLMCQLKAGDHVVSSRALFGSCFYIIGTLLPRYGIETSVSSIATTRRNGGARCSSKTQGSSSSRRRRTRRSRCSTLQAVAATSRTPVGARCWSITYSPRRSLQKPLQLGADIVVYSATKHIDGPGRCMGGAVLADAAFCKEFQPFLRHTGPALSPFNAWVLVKGLETLALRVEHQMRQTALKRVAELDGGHRAAPSARYYPYPAEPSAA